MASSKNAGSPDNAKSQYHLQLLQEAVKLRQNFRDGKPRTQLNMLLLGQPGVGKSTLVSSMLMAINPRGYQDIAMRGGYGEGGKSGRAAITLAVKKHFLFGDYIKEFQTAKENQYACQPQIWDCPGLPDEEYTTTPILRLIIEGTLREDANMSALLKMSPDALEACKVEEPPEEQMLDAIIVVHAATDPMPSNLMAAIRNAAQPNEMDKTAIPIYGVISKLDVLEEKEQKDQLPKIVENFAEELGLKGAEERIFSTSLYCRAVSPDLTRKHQIDKTICDLWNAMISNQFNVKRKKVIDEKSYVATLKETLTKWYPWK